MTESEVLESWNKVLTKDYIEEEAKEIVRQALEKQIPKKVINRCMFCECPTCGNVEIQSNSYCCDCGQRLDWSEE